MPANALPASAPHRTPVAAQVAQTPQVHRAVHVPDQMDQHLQRFGLFLGGKLLAKCPAYSRTVSSSETSLSAVFVWLKLELADSTIRSGYEISNSDEPPKTDGSYGFPFYVLIGVIQGGTARQAHYGPAVITDRYYDDTKNGENS